MVVLTKMHWSLLLCAVGKTGSAMYEVYEGLKYIPLRALLGLDAYGKTATEMHVASKIFSSTFIHQRAPGAVPWSVSDHTRMVLNAQA